ncbi:hypothetical protein POSPLADRAFT_1041861 [Postia placenta MAD-698-R-SB12]|uniref:Uncharacterized protein n=1 Tax=Postia placenta MAD-698-R-SB12 TaxID=670580 RepID=A0A1X6MKB7_9APHY|nr:hypothetical protein POSPLADRAFT_1041861 [Postia placenta MAD-698-R-SB12]OSX56805.1 hypothetical protein POSPLADRAFT_1041861 [Postia placenta MAD-698-R-SB12]
MEDSAQLAPRTDDTTAQIPPPVCVEAGLYMRHVPTRFSLRSSAIRLRGALASQYLMHHAVLNLPNRYPWSTHCT